MKEVMIHRDDKDYGPYSLEEVKDLVSKGILTQEDLAWVDGGNEWVPLGNLLSQASTSARETAFAASAVSPPDEEILNASIPSTKAYLIGATLFALLAVVVVVAVVEMRNTFAPLLALVDIKPATEASTDDPFTATGTGSFLAVTMQMNGSVMSATMTTDDSHKAQLCDQVMQEIYSLADKNPSASSLSLTIKIAGNPDAEVEVEDLDAVRKYQNKEAYASSEHRSFVGGRLVSAGSIDESSLAVKTFNGISIGAIYQNEIPPPPGFGHFGFRFINDSQAECLNDGVPYGGICPYTVDGDTVTITTSCSTPVYKIQGNTLVGDDGDTLTRLDP